MVRCYDGYKIYMFVFRQGFFFQDYFFKVVIYLFRREIKVSIGSFGFFWVVVESFVYQFNFIIQGSSYFMYGIDKSIVAIIYYFYMDFLVYIDSQLIIIFLVFRFFVFKKLSFFFLFVGFCR